MGSASRLPENGLEEGPQGSWGSPVARGVRVTLLADSG